ncbi:MAG TPA: response regulator [Opitutaceae bacterium]|nr:response regulator [Opitutaceae bacterium]
MPIARILVHENSFLKLPQIEAALRQAGLEFACQRTHSRAEFSNALSKFQPSLVLCDYDFAGLRAVEALALVRETAPQASFIVLSDKHGEELAVECMKNGATDYVFKDSPERLIALIRTAIEKHHLIREGKRLKQQHEVLLQLIPTCVCILTPGGILVDCNPAWTHQLGYPRESSLGQPLHEFVSGADRARFQAWWASLAAGSETSSLEQNECEVSMETVSDQRRYLTWTARFSPSDNSVYALGHDTTDRHVAEASLRESEVRFRSMADSTPAFIWVGDTIQQRTYWNQRWLDFTGRTLDQVVGTGWLDSIHADDRQRVGDLIETSHSARRPFKIEYRVKRSDGVFRWVLDNGSPRYDHHGALIGFIGSGIDISEQHDAEVRLTQRAIKQSALAHFGRFALAQHPFEELLREGTRIVHETLQIDASEVLSLSGPENTLEWVVSSGIAMPSSALPLGSLPPSALQETCFQLPAGKGFFPGEQSHLARGVQSAFAAVLSGGKQPYGYLIALSRAAEPFSRDSMDFVQGVANIIGTVAQRDQARAALLESEQKLLQSQKMEAVGILAGGVAHDFNNLLTAIRCYGDLLNEDLAESAPELQPKASEILKATERASALTRQLLAFSRKQVLQPEILDLNSIVSDVKDLVRSLLSENIELKILPAASPIYFEADRNQIDQVVINLCINARDAMTLGGAITLTIGSTALPPDNSHGLPAGDYAELRIADTGIGMSPEVQAKLFQPFFTTKPKGRGTGLGLATCAVIVKSSQGAIFFESQMGKGTTFTILLPQISALSVEAPVIEEAILGQGTERILLVEDDEAIRVVTSAILETLGYHVTVVAGGNEALELCSNPAVRPFDLLLTDIVMPNMNGKELASRIIKLCPSIRIMFMSGYVGDARILQAVQDAGGRFLEKPFTRASLARNVREVLEAPPPLPVS